MGYKIYDDEYVMNGNVEWYDYYQLNYSVEDWMDAVEELNLKIGDEIEIVIRKKKISL